LALLALSEVNRRRGWRRERNEMLLCNEYLFDDLIYYGYRC
jgi:hypothetical protein